MGPRRQDKKKSDDVCQRRVATEGKMIRSRLEWLLTTNACQSAGKEPRQHLIEERISRVRADVLRLRKTTK
jgi:hypothetical protein